MKMNKWTLGLAAVGLVSLTPGLLVPDTAAAPVPLTTALSATTISGYVDTSAVWNPLTHDANPAPFAYNAGKQDGFNLDSADVKIAKPLDEGQWSAGYTLEFMAGPDASLGPGTGVRQAYVELRANIGNGLDFKLGQWDNILGYESIDGYKNPNWTRSYGFSIEPTEHVGVLMSYKFCDSVGLQVGVANELSPWLNRNQSGTAPYGAYGTIEDKKAIVSLLTLAAPDSWGAMKGSALYVGFDYGPGNAYSHVEPGGPYWEPAFNSHVVDKKELYVGATIMTPVKGLSLGASWDSINNDDLGTVEGYASSMAGYISFKFTDKLTFNARGEYVHGSAFDNAVTLGKAQEAKILAATGTLQYDLWDNVISRVEVRWDQSADGSPMFGGVGYGPPTKNYEMMVAANVIYKF